MDEKMRKRLKRSKWRTMARVKESLEHMLALHIGQEPLASVLADAIALLEYDIERLRTVGQKRSDHLRSIHRIAIERSREKRSEYGKKGAKIGKERILQRAEKRKEIKERILSQEADAYEG